MCRLVQIFIYTYATGWPCGQANGRYPGRAPCQVFLFVKIPPRSFFWHFHFSGNFLALSLCRELRLRAGMFNDHMPWGYQVNSRKIQETSFRSFDSFQGLFKGLKGDDGGIGLTDLIKYL